MSISTTAHINFRGEARSALEFYQSVFGGHLIAVTYADAHAVDNPAEGDQVMWGQVASPSGFAVMAYDVPSRLNYARGDRSFFVSVRSADPAEISGYWAHLKDGAIILADLGPAAWAPLYGMLTDRFGITWVMDVAPQR
jgi:PhnB protein